MKVITVMVLLSLLVIKTIYANEADVLKVELKPAGPDTFQFFVTVRHADIG